MSFSMLTPMALRRARASTRVGHHAARRSGSPTGRLRARRAPPRASSRRPSSLSTGIEAARHAEPGHHVAQLRRLCRRPRGRRSETARSSAPAPSSTTRGTRSSRGTSSRRPPTAARCGSRRARASSPARPGSSRSSRDRPAARAWRAGAARARARGSPRRASSTSSSATALVAQPPSARARRAPPAARSRPLTAKSLPNRRERSASRTASECGIADDHEQRRQLVPAASVLARPLVWPSRDPIARSTPPRPARRSG